MCSKRINKSALWREMASHGHSFFQQLVMDPTLRLPGAKTELGFCPPVTLSGSFPLPLPADFIFLCFTQHSAAVTGKYLTAQYAIVQHTGEKTSLPTGVWVLEQINRKEKWCLQWGDKVERKMGRQTMEKSVIDSAFGETPPFSSPHLYYSPVA